MSDPSTAPKSDPASGTCEERFLYNLEADPHQQQNLVGWEDYRDAAGRLRDRLVDQTPP